MELIIITGLSGAGKSCALRALEDNGFYCVDNLPPAMIPELAGSLDSYRARAEGGDAAEGGGKAAVVVDARVPRFEDVLSVMDKLKLTGVPYRVLFLDATDETLDKRYKFTRRAHPLQKHGGIQEGIARERTLLEPVRARADLIVDTTDYTEKQLRARIADFIRAEREHTRQIYITTFGFKRGTPIDLDMLFDVRFLRNPYYDEVLKPLTGLDERIREYVFAGGAAASFVGKAAALIEEIFPPYTREVKNFLHLGVGCTGGRHRSVAAAEALAAALREKGMAVKTEHRDIAK